MKREDVTGTNIFTYLKCFYLTTSNWSNVFTRLFTIRIIIAVYYFNSDDGCLTLIRY